MMDIILSFLKGICPQIQKDQMKSYTYHELIKISSRIEYLDNSKALNPVVRNFITISNTLEKKFQQLQDFEI